MSARMVKLEEHSSTLMSEDDALLTRYLQEQTPWFDAASRGGMKDYARVYAQFQEYLSPDESNVREHSEQVEPLSAKQPHLGCMEGRLVRGFSAEHQAPVTDEELENLGYLGWLNH